MKTIQTATTEKTPNQQERIESHQKLMDSELHNNSLGLSTAFADFTLHTALYGKPTSVRFNFEVKEKLKRLRSFSNKNNTQWLPNVRFEASKKSSAVLNEIRAIIDQGNEKLAVLIAEHNHQASEEFIEAYWKLAYSKRPDLYDKFMEFEEMYEIIEATYILDILNEERVRPGKLMGVSFSRKAGADTVEYRVHLKRGRYKTKMKKGDLRYTPLASL